MTFDDRAKKTAVLANLLERYLWKRLETMGVKLAQIGYESFLPQDVREMLINLHSPTALFVRFLPDYVLLVKEDVMLVDYKVTTTPRYILGDRQWDYGQVEANAYEAYLALIKMGVKVAILNYCSYHRRPFFMD